MVNLAPASLGDIDTKHRRFRLRTVGMVLLFMTSWLALSGRALAACPSPALTDTNATVTEANTTVQFTVRIPGTDTHDCNGSVRVRTVDGTAKAPGDYTGFDQEVAFRPADDREETVTISIKNDSVKEQSETFKVELKPGTTPGNVHPNESPATIRINDDNDPAPSLSPSPTSTATSTTSPSPTPTATPTETPTAGESPSPSPTATPSETPTETPTPLPTETDTGLAAPPEEPSGGSGGKIAAIAVGVILLGGGVGLWLLRRRYGFR